MLKYRYYDMPKIANMFLKIYERIAQLLSNSNESFDICSFTQTWCNTSGGFEGIGGSAITVQLTIVVYDEGKAFIFFDGNYAYKINFKEINKDLFFEDLKNNNIAGARSYKKRY